MNKKLKELVDCLEAITSSTPNIELDEIISIIKKIKPKTQKKGEIDSLIASCILTTITLMPEVMQHPKNSQLKQLCRKLNPTDIYLSPFVWDMFLSDTGPNKILPKPTITF